MSDKSRLGFNINPNNYDELNSTDNIITSGSDSGWLGNKLQGGDSNDLDLSKINPLFDKELYEKYRPGVNTNDGSVNQDIWGYKCFNSPVSFGQSAYMLSVCTDMDMPNKIYYASVYDQPSIGYYVKSAKTNLITIHSNYNNGALSYLRSIHSNRPYDDYCNQSFDDPDFHGHDSAPIVNGDKRHHKADNIDNISDNIIQIGNQSKHCDTMFISRITSDIYGDLQYIQQGLDDQTGDVEAFFSLSDMQKYNSINESRTTVTSSDDLYTYSTNISGMSSFYHSPNKHAPDAKYKGIANRQSVIVLDSSFLNSDNSNDVDFTNYNGNATITLNAPVHHAPRHCLNYNGKIGLEISERYTFIGNTDTPQNITKSGYTYIEKDTISLGVTNSINQSIDNPYIKIDGADNSITLHAGKLNLPSTIETTAKFANRANALSKEINSANYIYATDNSILPSNDSVISLGSESYKYSNIYADRLIGIASAAEKLAYVNPTNNAETELLTVSNENLILPRGNKTIQLGSNDNRFDTIYGDLNGTAVIADHAGTAEQATKDQDGNIIRSSYLNILDFGRNNIESYNAIIGNEKEKLLFLKEKYFGTNADIPPINKSYASIKCAFTDTLTSYKTIISWSNEADDKPITKVCHVDYNLAYNYTTKKYSFYIMPNGVASDDPKYVESMNIGAPDAPWDNIYCKNFPTIHKTIGGYLVGSIRLLCIKTPATSIVGREARIYPGNTFGTSIEVPSSNTGTGTLTCTVSHAVFKVTGESAMHLEPTTTPMFEGTWQALCGVHIVIGTSITYIPVLAIRVE